MTEQQEPTTQPSATEEAAIPFDPSRLIGIIKRKALIKELAAAYHAECLKCCQELLELQKEWGKVHTERKIPENTKKETRVAKRSKKTH